MMDQTDNPFIQAQRAGTGFLAVIQNFRRTRAHLAIAHHPTAEDAIRDLHVPGRCEVARAGHVVTIDGDELGPYREHVREVLYSIGFGIE